MNAQRKKEKSLKSGDFSLFICIYAKKSVPLQPQRFARGRRARIERAWMRSKND